jgi:hypothetical protein
MEITTTTAPVARISVRTITRLPQRTAPILQAQQLQPFSVLQTGRAPAQLSLFLRPNINMR